MSSKDGAGGSGRPGTPEVATSFARALHEKVYLSLELAVRLVAARVGFQGGSTGAAAQDAPVLEETPSL